MRQRLAVSAKCTSTHAETMYAYACIDTLAYLALSIQMFQRQYDMSAHTYTHAHPYTHAQRLIYVLGSNRVSIPNEISAHTHT